MLKKASLIWLSSLCAIALWAIAQAELYVFRLVTHASQTPVRSMETDWLSVFLVVLVGPIIEEAVFRLGLIRMLMRRFPAALSVPISAIAFAVSHTDYVASDYAALSALLTLLTGGLVLGFVYVRAGSLVAPIVTHSVYNALSFLPVAFLYELEQLLPGAAVLSMSIATCAASIWCLQGLGRRFLLAPFNATQNANDA